MKLIKSILILNLFVLFLTQNSYAQDGTVGGDDGLDYRIHDARELAIEALTIASFETAPNEIKIFQAYTSTFLNELKLSKIFIRPAAEVNAMVGGVMKERKAVTGFFSLSDILINRDANRLTPVAELTAILLHEVGHHVGIADGNEQLDESDKMLPLNQVAVFILDNASKNNPLFQAKLYGNKPIYQLIGKLKNQSYCVSYPYQNINHSHDYEVCVDLENEKIAIIQMKENTKLYLFEELHLKKRKMRPMYTHHQKFAEVVLTPEALNQLVDPNKTHVTFNAPSTDPKKKTDYQITLNFKNNNMNMVTIVPLKKDKPVWRKSLTLTYPF